MFLRAHSQNRRSRALSLVMRYVGKMYPGVQGVHAGVYDNFEAFVDESNGHVRSVILIRVAEDQAEIHVVCAKSAFRDPKRADELLAFMQHMEQTRGIKSWHTFVLNGRPEISQAAIRVGFTPVTQAQEFIGYTRSSA